MIRSIALAASATIVLAACEQDRTRTDWVYQPGEHWPSRPVFPGVGGGLLVTTNSYDDTLTLLDLATLEPLAHIPVGLLPVEQEGPHHVIVSPDNQFLYVALSEVVPNSGSGPHGAHGTGAIPGYVLKIRVADMRQVGSVRVDRNPGDLLISPDGSTLYVSHFDVLRVLEVAQAGQGDARSGIAVVDTATMTRTNLEMTCVAEHGMALSPDGTRLYVSCYGEDALAVVDVTDSLDLVTEIVPLGPSPGTLPGPLFYGPYAATLDAGGETLWLSNWESGDIRAFDIASGTMDLARTIVTGGQPVFGAAVSSTSLVFTRQSGDLGFPDDRLVLVTDTGGGTASAIELPLDSSCVNAHAAVPDPLDPGVAIVVCEGNHIGDGSVVRVELVTGATVSSGATGIFPDSVRVVMP